MREGSRGIQFIQTQEQPNELDAEFKYRDFVTSAEINEYTQTIIDKINEAKNPEQQQVIILDLLKDDEILKFAEHEVKRKYPEFLQPRTTAKGKEVIDFEEIKVSLLDSINLIKKQIIEDLKPHVSPNLLMFVVDNLQEANKGSKNKLAIIKDSNEDLAFFKEFYISKYDFYMQQQKKCLEILKEAFSKLKDPNDEMPYVVRPLIISTPIPQKNNRRELQPIGYTVAHRDFNSLKDTVDKPQSDITTKECLLAMVDCLRGAKFLADSGLTLTDLQLKNLGIDKITKKGILFDLDGLLPINKIITSTIGPSLDQQPPEYRNYRKKDCTATGQSMIWEIGDALSQYIFKETLRLSKADMQVKFDNRWDILKEYTKKMTAKKPEDRPDFDTCIIDLTKIIEENFKQSEV